MKRDCMIVLVSICVFAMSAPKGLCEGLQGGNGFSPDTPATLQTDGGARDSKKQPKVDRSASLQTTTKEDRFVKAMAIRINSPEKGGIRSGPKSRWWRSSSCSRW